MSLNWLLAINWWIHKKRATIIPFIGGIIGSIGLFICPLSGFSKWWWTPLLIDIGCGSMIVGLFYTLIKTNLQKTAK
jgi:uncharacterized membrane protein